ncbi:MAG TPA: PfkB family carbohydrate kinase [Ktedonobacteraceae bacterium]|nr:PfkB family carbohydrate kinase [Ktedonobacteraceae bacterium]
MALEMNEPHRARESRTTPATHPRVIVVGNLTIDDVVLPDGTTQMGSVGGNSIYTALSARIWQPAVGIVTRRGEDFPREHSDALQALGVATTGIVDIPGPTVRNWVIYEADGERHWVYRTPRERSREVAVQPSDLPPLWLEGEPAPVVHVTAMPLEAAEAIVEEVRHLAPHAIITLDTHEDYVVDYRQRLRALAAKVDAFLPSRSELADLVGYDDPLRALGSLIDLPTPVIVLKMGEKGVLVWQKAGKTLHEVEIVPGPVMDVTGAGDAFCGGFAAGLSLGDDALRAAQRGIISASYAVASFGSLSLARIEPAEAQSRLSAHPPTVHSLSAPFGDTQIEVEGADRGISSATEVMRQEIAMVPGLLAEQLEALAEPIYTLARQLYESGIEHLYLTGCGDSAFAGAAVALAFQKHAAIDAEGIHALDLARYRVRYLPPRSAIACISFSGKVGRTIEAALQARRFGHRVLALTGNPDSPLAQAATDMIPLSVPTLGYSPGTSTYLAILTALLNLALAWGETRGRDASNARILLKNAPMLAQQTLAEADEPARKLAEQFVRQNWITFLGAGPNLATAQFGAAKLFEGPRRLGVATNIEEWAHEEYFVSGSGTPVLLIAPYGASFDRATEILSELNFIGAQPAFISDVRPARVPTTFLPLAPGLPEEFSPLLAALPLSLFAFYLTRASGLERFEFPSPEAAREHYETIHRVTEGEPA